MRDTATRARSVRGWLTAAIGDRILPAMSKSGSAAPREGSDDITTDPVDKTQVDDSAELTPTPVPVQVPVPAKPSEAERELESVREIAVARGEIVREIEKRIVGQRDVVDALLTALFARGHCLFVGVPGLAKTLLISTLAEVLNLSFNRVQFTPDLMPSDITGTDVLEEDHATGRRVFRFIRGPLFANIVPADEINRTPPKTQAAPLQAMQEHRVTAGGETHALKAPFLVFATQNPIEQEGTYPLPEAQLDRFMFNIPVVYPTPDEEVAIVKGTTSNVEVEIQPVLGVGEILRLQVLVRGVPVADSVVRYAVNLVGASRPPQGGGRRNDKVHKYLTYGGSPRASQYLILGAKARAILAGRFHVDFEDVRAVARPVLRHRLVLNFHARAEGVDADGLIWRLID